MEQNPKGSGGFIMKKLLTILLTVAMAAACCFGMVGCNDEEKTASDVKVGLICLHGDSSTYDKNFIDAMKEACENMNADLVIKTDVPEGQECYEAAVDLVDQGCDVIFADSFGHESFMLNAAKEYPDVEFCHATGTMAHTANQANFHNAFADIYEGRYLAGVAGGYKLADMEYNGTDHKLPATNYDDDGNIKIGYVGAFTYAEVISGYTSWYLGVKMGYDAYYGLNNIDDTAAAGADKIVMQVQFTGSWYDEAGEKSAAETLINNGCAIISQHADSMGAPNACETAKVPNVSYNGSTEASCPDTFIISSRINWVPYFEYMIDFTRNNKTIAADWTGGLGEIYAGEQGPVALTTLGAAAVQASDEVIGTSEILNYCLGALEIGVLKVFDCDTFTVTKTADKNVNATVDDNGKLTGYMADVNTDAAYTPDTEVVKTENGVTYFAESVFRSAPYFDIQIDGITLLNTKF